MYINNKIVKLFILLHNECVTYMIKIHCVEQEFAYWIGDESIMRLKFHSFSNIKILINLRFIYFNTQYKFIELWKPKYEYTAIRVFCTPKQEFGNEYSG